MTTFFRPPLYKTKEKGQSPDSSSEADPFEALLTGRTSW